MDSNDLLGSGSYGCVVKPPFTSKKYINKIIQKYTNVKKDDVGKLFRFRSDSKLQFENEYKIIGKLNKEIKNFDLITPKIKGINSIKNITDYEISKCVLKKSSSYYYDSSLDIQSKIIYQIIYENAGLSFSYIIKNNIKIDFKIFINALYNFFINFKTFNDSKYIHQDISYHNIMFKDDKILLIDFGLYINFNKIFTINNLSRLNHKYVAYPPEFKMCYYYFRDDLNLTKIDKILYNFELLNSNLFSKKFIKSEIQNCIMNFHPHKIDYKKVDIYSIGTSLYEIKDNILFQSETEFKYFHNLIKKMIHPNYNKRCSLETITKYTKKLIK